MAVKCLVVRSARSNSAEGAGLGRVRVGPAAVQNAPKDLISFYPEAEQLALSGLAEADFCFCAPAVENLHKGGFALMEEHMRSPSLCWGSSAAAPTSLCAVGLQSPTAAAAALGDVCTRFPLPCSAPSVPFASCAASSRCRGRSQAGNLGLSLTSSETAKISSSILIYVLSSVLSADGLSLQCCFHPAIILLRPVSKKRLFIPLFKFMYSINHCILSCL